MAAEASPVSDEPISTSLTQANLHEPDSTPQDAPEETKRKVPAIVWIGLAILGVTLAGLVGMSFLPDTVLARLRDVAIVFLVVLFFFLMLLLLFLVAALIYAVNRLSDRLDDLGQRGGAVLDQVKGTATTVKGTADFIGERVASPFIRVGSWIAGIGTGVKTFFSGQKQEEGHNERTT